jgi:Flp pilus assembly protein TadD
MSLGASLLEAGRTGEAGAEFREALRLKPDYAEAHCNLGNALWMQGKLSEAEAELRQAIALWPDYAEAHCNLGQVLTLMGRYAEALACYKQGHELGSKKPAWPYLSAQRMKEAER